MARFGKYNNPSKKRSYKKSRYSVEYIDQQREQLHQLLANCKDDSERDAIITAFNASINPAR